MNSAKAGPLSAEFYSNTFTKALSLPFYLIRNMMTLMFCILYYKYNNSNKQRTNLPVTKALNKPNKGSGVLENVLA